MKALLKLITATVSAMGFLSIGLSLPEPAKASISCQTGTIKNYSNGSLANCILNNNTDIGVNTNHIPCSQGQYISFNEKGDFSSCILSAPIQLRKNNGIITCPVNTRVSVSPLDNLNPLIISCGAGL